MLTKRDESAGVARFDRTMSLKRFPRALPPLTDCLSVKSRLSRATALVRAVWIVASPLLHLGIVGAVLLCGFWSAVHISPSPIGVSYLSNGIHNSDMFTLRSSIALVLVYAQPRPILY